jgi:cysteine-rich repeat protein
MRALWIAALSPACSLLFDARDLAEDFDPPSEAAGPIVHFGAQPLSIRVGDTALLGWKTEDAEEVTIREDGDRISSDVEGELLIQPDETATYRIEAGGETRELSVFVNRDVPPEIIEFELEPRVLTRTPIRASWRVTHGAVSLIHGDRILSDLSRVGSEDADVDATSDLLLFAFAGGSSEHRERAFAVEPLAAELPHRVGTDAVELQQTEAVQTLVWSLPERSSLLPDIVDDDGSCLDATLTISRYPDGTALGTRESCSSDPLIAEGSVLIEVLLVSPPARSFFLPERRTPACGNGVLEPEEACDDYDLSSGDGCSSTCTVEEGVHLVAGTLRAEPPELPNADARPLDFSAYDDGSRGWAVVASPFPLDFYGRRYAGLIVHRNGAITFDLSTTERDPRIPDRLPDPSVRHDIVIALAPTSDGAIDEYDALVWSEPGLLVIDLSGSDAHVQARFFESGEIEIRFGAVGDGSPGVASGLQERTGRMGSNSFTCMGECSLDQVPIDQSVRFQ